MADFDLIVVGGGAAGLIAATRAAEGGLRTLVLEKNRKPGVKILMSGGTRCNLTHATDRKGILSAFEKRQANFLQSALAVFGPGELTGYVEAEGIALKTEATGKIFPASDSAVDIQQAFLGRLQRSKALVHAGEGVLDVHRDAETSDWTIRTADRQVTSTRLLLTTGGQSYPGCGTTGDGFRWAARVGHTVVMPRPALVPLVWQVPWATALQGVTLPDVDVMVIDPALSGKEQVLSRCRGSFLFTHFGGSGPSILNVSRAVSGHARPDSLWLRSDWLPGKADQELQAWLLREASQNGKRQVATALGQVLPHRLVDALLPLANIPAERKLSELSKAERAVLLRHIKQTEIPIQGTLGFPKAEVTAGGVSLDEVDSRNLRSKVASNLWLAGELLDIDGPIGGYNFQAAFSTGWLAALSLCGER